jgi:hypothetical protein
VIVIGGRVLFKMIIVAGLISKKGIQVNEAYSDHINSIPSDERLALNHKLHNFYLSTIKIWVSFQSEVNTT